VLNDPLFLQTKIKIESWRKTKTHIREPIPEDIKKDIRSLAQTYPAYKIGSALKLGECSLRYLNGKTKKTKKLLKLKNNVAEFVEFSPQISKKPVNEPTKIELDLPMGMTLRIFL
jgi:hypothetical protein